MYNSPYSKLMFHFELRKYFRTTTLPMITFYVVIRRVAGTRKSLHTTVTDMITFIYQRLLWPLLFYIWLGPLEWICQVSLMELTGVRTVRSVRTARYSLKYERLCRCYLIFLYIRSTVSVIFNITSRYIYIICLKIHSSGYPLHI